MSLTLGTAVKVKTLCIKDGRIVAIDKGEGKRSKECIVEYKNNKMQKRPHRTNWIDQSLCEVA